MKLSLVLAITLFGLVALHWAEAGTMDSHGTMEAGTMDCHYVWPLRRYGNRLAFCCGCHTWERKIWREACKGQGGLGRPKGDPRDPCIICYKIRAYF